MSSTLFPTRTTAALGLIGALALSAWFWWPASSDTVPMSKEGQTVATAPIAAEAVPAASAAFPLGKAALAASAPWEPARPPEASPIGSEGYGPHIDRARDGADPKAAWQAVAWLQACRRNASDMQAYQQARDSGAMPEVLTRLIVETQAEARRCQTVSTQHQALLPELTLQAMRGGVAGAGVAYAGGQGFEQADPALQAELRSAIRRDASAGDRMTLFNAALSDARWGLSYEERLSYLLAFGLLSQGGAQHLQALGQSGEPKIPAPNSAQAAAAQAAAQKIADTAKAKAASGP
ncbi:MAG: hypothetical protein CFE43_09250 [Burkholderiales bacterium PBB3]|nr:MAG: hypothetical protein CFE43_09250 [Burkholderiales bacterium PBB3]